MARFFITGGGTGGHIYPAIAIADELDDIFYIGNPNNMEYGIAEQKGYRFLSVNIHGMPRKIGLQLLIWTIQLFIAVCKCCYYIAKHKPDAVFGTGGYVSAPALIAAAITKTPYMMHDCDAQPGLVTRKLAPYASQISVAFDTACKFIKNKNCIVNGNPIRNSFKYLTKEQAREKLELQNKTTLCIMGGSQGAKAINDATINTLEKLSEELDLQIIFQTGKKNFEDVINTLEKVYPNYKNNSNIIIKPYFDDMTTVLKATDIAISRSGSLSISEICACAIAPIFVPYPHAAADHQRKNAKFMVDKGAGLYIEDSELSSEKIIDTISDLISNHNRLNSISEHAYSLAKLDSTQKIVEQLVNITKK